MGFMKLFVLVMKVVNKFKRWELYVQYKKISDKECYEVCYCCRKEEVFDFEFKKVRFVKNKFRMFDEKCIWDDVDDDSFGVVVDFEQLRWRRMEQVEEEENVVFEELEVDDDDDSMFDLDEDEEVIQVVMERK